MTTIVLSIKRALSSFHAQFGVRRSTFAEARRLDREINLF